MSKAKGWFKRIFAGQILQRSHGNAVADVERTFNRDADRYTEKVTLQDTGEVIHEANERLSDHKGHGSDKPHK